MQDYYNYPISVSDATAMFRRNIPSNTRPYEAKVIKLNNEMVDDWKNNVLDKIADQNGKIKSGRISGSWKLYEEGKGHQKFFELKTNGMLPEIPLEMVNWWKNFFESSTVEEMHSYGTGAISSGWTIIQEYFKMWYAEKKWNEFFSKSEDPLWWERNYHKHSLLLEGKILPFWTEEQLKDIGQKVGSILINTVDPRWTEARFN
ncbi:MAG: hypothetical protein ACFFD1_15125 [Candidatus Thorarchaeota archaeon]